MRGAYPGIRQFETIGLIDMPPTDRQLMFGDGLPLPNCPQVFGDVARRNDGSAHADVAIADGLKHVVRHAI